MVVKAEKLDTSILALLHLYPHGKGAGSLADWCKWIEEMLGERPSDDAAVASLKRLRDRGLIRLAKYTSQYDSWYDYKKDARVDERWFFCMGAFWIMITEEGRSFQP